MPFKTMSQREQRRAKHRLRELELAVRSGRYESERQVLSRWSGVGIAMSQEVATASRLGYVVEVARDSDDALTFTAVKAIPGWKKLDGIR